MKACVELLIQRGARLAFATVFLISLVSCWGGDPGGIRGLDSLREELAILRADLAELSRSNDPGQDSAFTLQLLHASDMDGSTGALQNVENFSAILSYFRDQLPENTLVVSSGDNFIPGPRYYASSDPLGQQVLGVPGNGRADIALLNAMGFQASAVGNHELDRGTAEFASIVAAEAGEDGAYPGTSFPYLSSNLLFSEDEDLAPLVVSDGQDAGLIGGSLAGTAVIPVGGQRIGVVGATTPSLASITGSGDITVLPASHDLNALVAIIQAAVDELVEQGINKVILLAHMQRLDIEQALAGRLKGVDIIVGGGSNAILADNTDRLRPGDIAAGAYPLHFVSPSSEPVLLLNTDADYRYLGRLVVNFDHSGRVMPQSVDPYVSGAYATDLQGGQLFAGRPLPEVARVAGFLRQVLQERDGNILGRTSVYLAGRREDVRTEETNLGNLTADANLWMARLFDPEVRVSIKNGGGIRDQIGQVRQPPGTTSPDDVAYLPPEANPVAGKQAGEISQLDIEGALRFNNGLVIVPLTARELVSVMEHSIGFDAVGEASVGNFPQVGGLRFSFDSSAPPGQRIRSLAIVGGDGRAIDHVVEEGELTGDPGRKIKVVTLNYLGNGGGGFPFPNPHPERVDLAGEAGQPNPPEPDNPDANGNGVIDGPEAVDPGQANFAPSGTEQDALAEYLARFFSEEPYGETESRPLDDRRIQNLGLPGMTDTVFQPMTDTVFQPEISQ